MTVTRELPCAADTDDTAETCWRCGDLTEAQHLVDLAGLRFCRPCADRELLENGPTPSVSVPCADVTPRDLLDGLWCPEHGTGCGRGAGPW
jgi:hypothetical protein